MQFAAIKILVFIIWAIILSPALSLHAQSSTAVSLDIDANKVAGRVDKKIYGQLLEHIYR